MSDQDQKGRWVTIKGNHVFIDEEKAERAARQAANLLPFYMDIPEYHMFTTQLQKWTSGIDPDARDFAFQIAKSNPILLKGLLEEQFGEKPPEVVTLYRVGNLSDGITSFFLKRSQAEAYQRRMGVDSIFEFEAKIQDIVPTGGEVWAYADDVWLKRRDHV